MTRQARDPRERLGEFAGYLREHGFHLGFAEVQLMARAAADAGLAAWPHVEARWRAIAAGNRAEWRNYSELHRAFWYPQRVQGTTRASGLARRGRTIPELIEERAAATGDEPPRAAPSGGTGGVDGVGESLEEAGSRRAQGGASRAEALEQRDFADWTPEQVERLDYLVDEFQRRVRRRLLRRWRSAKRGEGIDLRRSLRASLANAGELIELRRLRRRSEPPGVVLLVDVSRSMEVHAQFYLRIARAFVEGLDARAFVFHTRLAEITALMRRGGRRVQEKINAVTFGFGGGTRIASCLDAALRQHLNRSLRRGDFVFIFSDGYDTDDSAALALVLAEIRARGARIVWLHPTLQPPASTALAAARNLVNRFFPAHNLASLARLPDLFD